MALTHSYHLPSCLFMHGFVLPSPYRRSVTVPCQIAAQHFHHACQLQPVLLPLSFSSSPSLSLAASGLTVHPSKINTLGLPSWVGAASLLSTCINIYPPPNPMSPVNTLLLLRNNIITSYSRVPLNPKVTAEHISTSTPLPFVFFAFFPALIGQRGRIFDTAVIGDLGFCGHQPLSLLPVYLSQAQPRSPTPLIYNVLMVMISTHE